MADFKEDEIQWTRLVVLHGRVEHRLAEVMQRRHGLGLSEYRALCHLSGSPDGELRMQELADKVGLNQSSVSRLVNRLERQNLTRRTHCPKDRRGVYTEITDAGRKLHDDAEPTYLDTLTAALDEVGADEELAPLARRVRSTE